MTRIADYRSLAREYLEEISQSLFFENAYFGFALLSLSLFFNWWVFTCGIAASLAGFAYSRTYRTPRLLKVCGLVTINGFFFGIALAALFPGSAGFYFFLAVGALIVPLLTKAAFEVLQHWKLTPLIVPYIAVVWVLALCGDKVALGPLRGPLPAGRVPSLHPGAGLWLRLVWSAALGMGRLFFLPVPAYGFCLFALILAFSPRRGVFFLLGTALATGVAYAVSGGGFLWEYGFSNYSAGIVGLGLASLAESIRARTIFLFCAISLFVTMALDRLLGSMGLPALSLPYVLTFWFAQLSRTPRLNVGWASSGSP